MKKLILSVMFFLPCQFCIGQNENVDGDKWEVGLLINTIEKIPTLGAGAILDERYYLDAIEKDKSFSLGLICNHASKTNMVYRLKICYTKRFIEEERPQPLNSLPDFTTNKSVLKQTNFKFCPGIKWSMTQDKFNIYGGFELPFSIYSKILINSSTKLFTSDTLSYLEESNMEIPNGMSVGIGGFSGFKVNISNHISIGSEISFACSYSSMGKGETIQVVTGNIPNGLSQTSVFKYNDSIQRFGIFNVLGSFNVVYRF